MSVENEEPNNPLNEELTNIRTEIMKIKQALVELNTFLDRPITPRIIIDFENELDAIARGN